MLFYRFEEHNLRYSENMKNNQSKGTRRIDVKDPHII